MKIKRSLKATMLLGVSVLLLAGCGQNKSDDSKSSTSSHKVSQTADNGKKDKKRKLLLLAKRVSQLYGMTIRMIC